VRALAFPAHIECLCAPLGTRPAGVRGWRPEVRSWVIPPSKEIGKAILRRATKKDFPYPAMLVGQLVNHCQSAQPQLRNISETRALAGAQKEFVNVDHWHDVQTIDRGERVFH